MVLCGAVFRRTMFCFTLFRRVTFRFMAFCSVAVGLATFRRMPLSFTALGIASIGLVMLYGVVLCYTVLFMLLGLAWGHMAAVPASLLAVIPAGRVVFVRDVLVLILVMIVVMVFVFGKGGGHKAQGDQGGKGIA